MKPVYTWMLIYILLLLLPSQLEAQPRYNDLRDCIGKPILQNKTPNDTEVNHVHELRIGQLIAINGNYGLIWRQINVGTFTVITNLNPPTLQNVAALNILTFEPNLVLKSPFMELLSNS